MSNAVTTPLVFQLVVAFLAIIALNAFFVAGDTAIDLLKASHEKALKDGDERQLEAFNDLMENKPSYVAACSLGSMTMRAWAVALTILPAFPMSDWMRGQFNGLSNWNDSALILLSVLLIAIPVVALNIVFGELIPKSYAAAHPVATSLRLRSLVRVFNSLFSGPIKIVVALAGLVTKRFGAKATFAVANQTEEDIKELLEEAEESGEIEEEEREMVASVFEFGDTIVREVMTPRVDLKAVSIDTEIKDVAQLVEETGHSRIPVYEESEDQIVGIIHAKDVLSAIVHGRESTPLRLITRDVVYVPEGKDLHDLLQEMRQRKVQMAVVLDEHSGTAGIVTIEDIVEEVMGEIVDEYDEDLPEIVELDGGFESDGKMELDEVNEAIGSSFDSEEFDTIGGFVFGLFGRQPKSDESVEGKGYRFTVTETDGKRIDKIFIEKLPEVEYSDTDS